MNSANVKAGARIRINDGRNCLFGKVHSIDHRRNLAECTIYSKSGSPQLRTIPVGQIKEVVRNGK